MVVVVAVEEVEVEVAAAAAAYLWRLLAEQGVGGLRELHQGAADGLVPLGHGGQAVREAAAELAVRRYVRLGVEARVTVAACVRQCARSLLPLGVCLGRELNLALAAGVCVLEAVRVRAGVCVCDSGGGGSGGGGGGVVVEVEVGGLGVAVVVWRLRPLRGDGDAAALCCHSAAGRPWEQDQWGRTVGR